MMMLWRRLHAGTRSAAGTRCCLAPQCEMNEVDGLPRSPGSRVFPLGRKGLGRLFGDGRCVTYLYVYLQGPLNTTTLSGRRSLWYISLSRTC
jgi:hypothetical protein